MYKQIVNSFRYKKYILLKLLLREDIYGCYELGKHNTVSHNMEKTCMYSETVRRGISHQNWNVNTFIKKKLPITLIDKSDRL